MRRVTRGIILNLVFFGVALTLLIYSNRAPSPNQRFAWTTVRYKPTSPALRPPLGECPGLEASKKPALVVASVLSDDVQWLDTLPNKYHKCIYATDAPSKPGLSRLSVPENRGHEAMAYLTFIIDNYKHIPAAGAVFVHSARFAWHNDHPTYDNAALLASLNVSAALEPAGYHNLRCDWSASTCSASGAPPQGSVETYARGVLEPWNTRVVSDKTLPRALAVLFGEDASGKSGVERVRLGRSEALRAQCCAQFVVSRERVWQHSRAEYVALRQWLLDSDAAPRDDRVAGRILSYVWHILFLPHDQAGSDGSIDLTELNSLACPRASDCYCRLYGRCDLQGCTGPGRCHGQYRVPPEFKLPDDWAAKHS